jgi:tryptophan 2,3-dioxygenase
MTCEQAIPWGPNILWYKAISMDSHGKEELIEPTRHSVTYGSYLKVRELLSLQSPLTVPEQHDEVLFIIIHQVYELWFKQILHETKKAASAIDADNLMLFSRTANRIQAIQNILTQQVGILETMTPSDFNTFRDRLNPASGFQSWQFRELEFYLGYKDAAYMKFHKNDPTASLALETALNSPSIYDKFLRLLKRRGFAIPDSVIGRLISENYLPNDQVCQEIVKIYKQSDKYYDLYSALEAMIDLDEGVLLWRQRHVAMVERMIGNRRGTGGSSGVSYLSKTLTKRFFPDIWDARNYIGDSEYGRK